MSFRSVRRPHQRHDATDVQEEKVVVEGGVLEPAEEGAGEEVRDPEICHQARQKAAGGDARADRRSGKKQWNRTRRLEALWVTGSVIFGTKHI